MFFKRDKNKNTNDRPGLIVMNRPSSVISEQFRTIRTNIQYSMIDEELKTIVVTSAGPSSGKSTVSANLAAIFASEDKRVLLVDADLRKPTVHKTFNTRNNIGMTTLLTDRSLTLEDSIARTQVEGLYLLTSGAIPPNPAELLASKRINEIIEIMQQQFDMIIFDMPPVLAVTDAQIMASKVDGVLFVIPKGEVKKDHVIKSKELLDNVQAKLLGAVMNKVEKTEENYYYYYGN
ncbi:CpsD/CapB family tyrosine-protein kinase [Marinilactibacillus sp. XAAS-LB27]|uniref:CpsD/CapB family tyrosine-protein kinase n=1 Tax=Marinilactibacillus sp. XAAS-LB27 TaxID=3114538 RepID=UPI002E1982F8|nr:CpsD/CapB family tyrosine-protein kinase [Marinilactibacillus sp. XAAS-LB27]